MPVRYQGGLLGISAWVKTFNPAETIRAIIFAGKMGEESRHLQQALRYDNVVSDDVQFEDEYQNQGYQGGGYAGRGNKSQERRSRY